MNENEAFFEELQRDVDADHRRVDGASAPPAGMWKSIRAQVKPATKKEQSMITPYTMPPVTVASPRRQQPGRFRHTLSIAPSFLIVMTVALAGWFATMQLNQPGESNGPLALFGQMDESATCDAEPLSVARVMEIVRNPYPFMANGPAGEPTVPENPDNPFYTGLQEAFAYDVVLSQLDPPESPSDDVFEEAGDFANSYLQCLVHGTRGQIWTFLTPVHIQVDVLSEFPVFANEAEVRARVEERIALPASDPSHGESSNGNSQDILWSGAVLVFEPASVTVNPDPSLALQRQAAGFSFDYVVAFGVNFEDLNGDTVYLTSGTGNEIVKNHAGGTYNMKVLVARHSYYDDLYIVPSWP